MLTVDKIPFIILTVLGSGTILSALTSQRKSPSATQGIAIAAVGISCALSLILFYNHIGNGIILEQSFYGWLKYPNLTIDVGVLIDDLSVIMMSVVTTVSLAVHFYSLGYMRSDRGQARFFSLLCFFTFMMTALVSANNLVFLFFGWEGVGLASYLLIGFWYTKPAAATASLKAFLVNRFGDIGVLAGIILTYKIFHTFNFLEISRSIPPELNHNFLATSWVIKDILCMFFIMGLLTKSAQFPLQFWLPDSMEGPTPISALIHAATMVTAGIFLVLRLSGLFSISIISAELLTVIGAITIISMGAVALVQNDIKRIIAYSTISQLGYMVVALGLGAYKLALFHLVTHAFFKALLFLGAGAVIHSYHHEQNIQRMGGMWHTNRKLSLMMLIGFLSLIGFPGFAGYYSKELILQATSASPHYSSLHNACIVGLIITALYSIRTFYYVFLRSSSLAAADASVPASMSLSLISLTVCSLLIGPLGYNFLLSHDAFTGVNDHQTAQALIHNSSPTHFAIEGLISPVFLILLTAVLGGLLGLIYQPRFLKVFKPASLLLSAEWGFNIILNQLFIPCFFYFFEKINAILELFVIDKLLVDGWRTIATGISYYVRRLQDGSLQFYIALGLLGQILMALFLVKV